MRDDAPAIAIAICLAGLMILSIVPASLGQSQSQGTTDVVTFYGHIFGHRLDAPMPSNTEAPIGEDNYGFGSYHACVSQASYGTYNGLDDGCKQDMDNKVALFSTPGFVDVENRAEWESEGTYSQLHNERGQTKDILLDTSQSISAKIYMTVDFHAWPAGGGETSCSLPHPEDVPCFYPYWGWDVGIQPAYTVEATLYKAQLGDRGANASDAPPIQQTLESGEAEVVAQGQWGPDQVITGLPGAPGAQEFNIDLGAPQVDTIPKEEDFFLVYSFYSESGGQTAGGPTWRLWAGEFFAPSYTLPVKNAFDVERVIPNFAHGKLAILGVMNTPWGSYDIDPGTVELTIDGPDGEVAPQQLSRFGDFSVAHGGHYLPINITWIWDYRQEADLRPGEYTVTLDAQNFQHSASGSCQATFTLERNSQGQLVPGSVEEGVCGLQSADKTFLEDIEEGATQGGS